MKKIKYFLLLLAPMFLLTGCVKYNATMDIKKDKSMDFSITYALDTSLMGDKELLSDEQRKTLENQGFTITDYLSDNMKGFVISRHIKNIDLLSSKNDTEYSLSELGDKNSDNNYIFKVKKGILKNTYTAKFKFDASDSNLEDDSSDDDWSFDNESDDTLNWDFGSDSTDNDSSFDFGSDLSNMMSNMDLSFNVNLPYSAKSNNATTVNNDNKNLTWNLSSNSLETIEFEFELYNMTPIYIGIGVIAVLVIIIIALLLSGNNTKNNNTYQTNTSIKSNENGTNDGFQQSQQINQQPTVSQSQTPFFNQNMENSNLNQQPTVSQPQTPFFNQNMENSNLNQQPTVGQSQTPFFNQNVENSNLNQSSQSNQPFNNGNL